MAIPPINLLACHFKIPEPRVRHMPTVSDEFFLTTQQDRRILARIDEWVPTVLRLRNPERTLDGVLLTEIRVPDSAI